MAARTLARRCSLTRGEPCRTNETSDFDTPARVATVRMVGGRTGPASGITGGTISGVDGSRGPFQYWIGPVQRSPLIEESAMRTTVTTPVWLDPADCRVDDLHAVVEPGTDPADHPRAEIVQGVAVYRAAALLAEAAGPD